MANIARVETRRELSEFVMSRRKTSRPEDVGLMPGPRRRTPGLRREEVAQLAGVGVTWYTWFEQGRDIRVSTHFLENVCRALCLTATERAHLFTLAQHRPPPHSTVELPTVTHAVQAMLSSLPNPAYITTQRWDVVAWNKSAVKLFLDYSLIPSEKRNHLWLVFTDPKWRRLLLDWEEVARDMLANVRINYARANGDPTFDELVAALEDASPEFRRWWPLQSVYSRSEGVKRLRDESMGEVQLEHTAFLVEGAPQLRMVIYTPVSEYIGETTRDGSAVPLGRSDIIKPASTHRP